MFYAVASNIDGIKLMLDLGASFVAVDSVGRNVLHYIAQTDLNGELL